jgi:hypothetical protein
MFVTLNSLKTSTIGSRRAFSPNRNTFENRRSSELKLSLKRARIVVPASLPSGSNSLAEFEFLIVEHNSACQDGAIVRPKKSEIPSCRAQIVLTKEEIKFGPPECIGDLIE